MDGLIILNKPRGITSAKALYRVRKITGQKKSGHAGTLDPAAEGVLILCLGKATKLVERLMELPKTYRATGRLDVTSFSLDSDSALEPVAIGAAPGRDEVEACLRSFVGVTQQTPPAVSAVKIAGRPAYKLARRGELPELRARNVRIDAIRLIAYEWPAIEFEMSCGRGTYVRSLIRDLGAKLGVGGCLTGLVRSAVGPFNIDNAVTLEEIAERPDAVPLIPLDEAVARVTAATEQIARAAAGESRGTAGEILGREADTA